MAKDYYQILGVSKNATEEEIKKAFRNLAHQHHPDKDGGNEQKFKEINEAYQVLGNAEKRKKYDQFGSGFENMGAGQGAYGGGFNWSDFTRQAGYGNTGGSANFDFEDLGDIFGDFFGGGGRSSRRTQSQKAGRDIEVDLNLTFEEAAFGTEKILRINKLIVCDRCSGQGAEPDTKIETCKTCHGSGQVSRTQQTFFGAFNSVVVCPECEGEGKVPKEKCAKCAGKGILKGSEEIKVKIPAGIGHGESIRLSDKGEPGEKARGQGDLYLNINIEPSRIFLRDGYDIRSVQEIAFSQAALGDKIFVETLYGPVKLKIHPGTKSGQEFKLANKGIEKLRGKGKGDHIVKIVIAIPENLTAKQKKLIEELGKEGI